MGLGSRERPGFRVLNKLFACRSKGYGFVSFRTQEAAENGIAMMNGKLVGHRWVLMFVSCDFSMPVSC